uniref:Glutaredoxin domain-containing protein n=1 Tax=Pseudo-nitzschia australis TaxID=44445 RepID=A0A7S4EMH9_9STRA
MLSRTFSSLIRRQSVSAATSRSLSQFVGAYRYPAAAAAAAAAVTASPSASVPRRRFSDDGTHDDFAPKKKAVTDDVDEAVEMIKQHVNANAVMLYMKGNPSMPMCGFSAQIVKTLQAEGVDFSSVNVLDYPSIREGVKKFAAWPTIPQLYINGEFIGGNDIVSDMHESGELKELLAEAKLVDKE